MLTCDGCNKKITEYDDVRFFLRSCTWHLNPGKRQNSSETEAFFDSHLCGDCQKKLQRWVLKLASDFTTMKLGNHSEPDNLDLITAFKLNPANLSEQEKRRQANDNAAMLHGCERPHEFKLSENDQNVFICQLCCGIVSREFKLGYDEGRR
jgi:hypothetical protein